MILYIIIIIITTIFSTLTRLSRTRRKIVIGSTYQPRETHRCAAATIIYILLLLLLYFSRLSRRPYLARCKWSGRGIQHTDEEVLDTTYNVCVRERYYCNDII
jgi:hypothetical protein